MGEIQKLFFSLIRCCLHNRVSTHISERIVKRKVRTENEAGLPRNPKEVASSPHRQLVGQLVEMCFFPPLAADMY